MSVDTSLYGEPVQHYKGTGKYRHNSITSPRSELVECIFELYQLYDGTIRLRCEADLHDSWHYLEFGPQVDLTLEGNTNEGIPVFVNGDALCSMEITYSSDDPQKPVVIDYLIHSKHIVHIGNASWDGEAELRFTLVNFRFLGTNSIEIEPGHSKLGLLPLSIANTIVEIYKVPDYEARLDKLKQIGGIDITSEAKLIIRSPEQMKPSEELMDNLCRLLSIASGTLISWLYFEVKSKGEQIFVSHRASITRNYTATPLIDPRQMRDIKVFVETTYKRYVELISTHRMIQIVHMFTEIRGNNFLETRGLELASLVDYLVGTLAKITGNDTLIPQSLFENGKDKYKKCILKALDIAYPDLEKDIKDILIQKSQENFPTLRRMLKLFCEKYKVPVTKSERAKFINNRNSLAHRASFDSSQEYKELASMIHLLDRMILCWLGYSGPYINIMTWEREELIFNSK